MSTMTDSRFKIIEIQAGLGFSNHCFVQLRDDIGQELEEKRFANTTLKINKMKQTMCDTIKLKF